MAANSYQGKKKFVYELSYDYWDTCGIGPNNCTSLSFVRNKLGDRIEAVLPCGGTSTRIFLFKDSIQNGLIEQTFNYDECPPIFDLTKLEDGRYGFFMLACNLGGGISFHLESKEQ